MAETEFGVRLQQRLDQAPRIAVFGHVSDTGVIRKLNNCWEPAHDGTGQARIFRAVEDPGERHLGYRGTAERQRARLDRSRNDARGHPGNHALVVREHRLPYHLQRHGFQRPGSARLPLLASLRPHPGAVGEKDSRAGRAHRAGQHHPHPGDHRRPIPGGRQGPGYAVRRRGVQLRTVGGRGRAGRRGSAPHEGQELGGLSSKSRRPARFCTSGNRRMRDCAFEPR